MARTAILGVRRVSVMDEVAAVGRPTFARGRFVGAAKAGGRDMKPWLWRAEVELDISLLPHPVSRRLMMLELGRSTGGAEACRQ